MLGPDSGGWVARRRRRITLPDPRFPKTQGGRLKSALRCRERAKNRGLNSSEIDVSRDAGVEAETVHLAYLHDSEVTNTGARCLIQQDAAEDLSLLRRGDQGRRQDLPFLPEARRPSAFHR